MLRNTNKHFWRRCRGTIVVVIFEPSLPVYLFFYFLFSFILFFYHGKPFYPKPFCTQGRVCRATTIIEANHSFQLRALPWLYSHGSGIILLRFLMMKTPTTTYESSSSYAHVCQSQAWHKKHFGGSCFPSLSVRGRGNGMPTT